MDVSNNCHHNQCSSALGLYVCSLKSVINFRTVFVKKKKKSAFKTKSRFKQMFLLSSRNITSFIKLNLQKVYYRPFRVSFSLLKNICIFLNSSIPTGCGSTVFFIHRQMSFNFCLISTFPSQNLIFVYSSHSCFIFCLGVCSLLLCRKKKPSL